MKMITPSASPARARFGHIAPLLAALALLAGAVHFWPMPDDSGPPPSSEPFGWDVATMRLSAARALSEIDRCAATDRCDFDALLLDLRRDEDSFDRAAGEHERLGYRHSAGTLRFARETIAYVRDYADTLAQASCWGAEKSVKARGELAKQRQNALRFALFTEQEVRRVPGAGARADALQESHNTVRPGER